MIYKKVPIACCYTMDHSTVGDVFDPAGNLRPAQRHAQSAQECAQDLGRIPAAA